MTADRSFPGKMNLQRWAAALVVLLSVIIAFNFNARLATIRQMRQDEAQLKQSVEAEESRAASLKSLRSYVASDRYVEHWARAEARMIKPGEVAVVPVAPHVAPANSSAAASVRAPVTIFDEWWNLFFGETPATP